MEKEFKIEPAKVNQYVARELKKKLKVIAIVFGALLLAFIILALVTKVYFIPLVALGVFGLVYIYVSAIFKGDLKTLGTAFRFVIDNGSISRSVDWSKLNTFQKIRAQRASAKYGAHLEQKINITDIAKVIIEATGVKIKSTNANPINENGIIIIPAEVKSYDQLVSYFSTDAEIAPKVVQI